MRILLKTVKYFRYTRLKCADRLEKHVTQKNGDLQNEEEKISSFEHNQ